MAPSLTDTSQRRQCPTETFIATRGGWLHLAVLLDLCSRTVVGWSMGDRNDVTMVKAALQMAIDHWQPPLGLIHHADRGSLYAADDYRTLISTYGMVASYAPQEGLPGQRGGRKLLCHVEE